MNIDYDVAIVGGGLVGGAFALDLALRNSSLNIAIFEKKKMVFKVDKTLDNKIYAISPQNIDYLNKLGVISAQSRIGTIAAMDIYGDQNSNLIMDKTMAKQLFLAKTIEANTLQQQIYEKLYQLENVTFIYAELLEINNCTNYAQLKFHDRAYTTRLLVGADGANSFVRNKLNIVANIHKYNQSGVVANFKCEKPHFNTAYQWFKNGDILAYLPLPDQQISIVWSTSKPELLLNQSVDDFSNHVMGAGNNILGKLTLTSSVAAFPLQLYIVNKIYTANVVLIGDAAHTIHPLAGMGVNLGFYDSQLLAELMAKSDIRLINETGVLAKYNHLRFYKVREMQLLCDGLFKLFATDLPLIKILRNVGLNLLDKFPVAKKYLIKRAISY